MAYNVWPVHVWKDYPPPQVVVVSVIVGNTVDVTHWIAVVAVLVNNTVIFHISLGIGITGHKT